MVKIYLNKGKEQSLKRFHPWVFSGAINRIDGNPAEGDVVEVYSKSGEFLGCGHYQIGSITVRILSFDECEINQDFWYNRLMAAYKARESLGLTTSSNTNCYRLVHGEGDFLPGLIIDIYNKTAVLQAHSAGMFLAKREIADALQKVYGSALEAIYDKSQATAPFKAGLDLKDGYIWGGANAAQMVGANGAEVVIENSNKFYVNWIEGQKTGFFLDQRDNRELVGKYAKGKSVLNLFCYTGGFSIYALNAGAKSVDSVDSSKKAMELVDQNVVLNGFNPQQQHHSYCEDAIEFMRNAPANKYDLIVVDPPAFAKHRGALDNALRAYKRLNALAIEKVKAGGLVFCYSCSQVVDKQAFALAIFSAAAQTGRKVRILHRLTQPADHPVSIYHPEGEYLKGLVLLVE